MTSPTDRFEGTSNYIATNDLKIAVNASVALQRPLLIKGEPGTGKTVLAYEMAKALNAPLITCTSSRRPKPTMASMSTTPSAACATANSATPASTMSVTI